MLFGKLNVTSEKEMATFAWKIPWMQFLLEREMETHSSVLAWRIPWTGGPGGLPSVGFQRHGHD